MDTEGWGGWKYVEPLSIIYLSSIYLSSIYLSIYLSSIYHLSSIIYPSINLSSIYLSIYLSIIYLPKDSITKPTEPWKKGEGSEGSGNIMKGRTGSA
jgi:hypothetical protein